MGIDDFRRDNSANNFPQSLRNLIKGWDGWNVRLNERTTGQIDDVAAIVFKMGKVGRFDKNSFRTARDERAEETREEKPSLCEEYYKTPHKHCVTNLGYTRDNGSENPMMDFIDEAENVWEEYQRGASD